MTHPCSVNYLAEHPNTQQRLCARAREAGTRFSWGGVLEQLLAGVEIITVGPPGSQLRGQWPLVARATTG